MAGLVQAGSRGLAAHCLKPVRARAVRGRGQLPHGLHRIAGVFHSQYLPGNARIWDEACRKHRCVDVVVVMPRWRGLRCGLDPASVDLVADVRMLVERLNASQKPLCIMS